MFGIQRIRLATLATPKQLVHVVRRSISTTQCVPEYHKGSDRSISTAYVKRGLAKPRIIRKSPTTSVDWENANGRYYQSIPVVGAPTLSKETANAESVNKVLRLDKDFMESIGTENFPGFLGNDFKLFGRPALLYRSLTQRLVSQMSKSARRASPKATILDGKAGTGKSAELLMVAAIAASSGHIVVYAPKTISWVNSTKPYAPDANNSGMFVQPDVTAELLRRIYSMSKEALEKVPLGKRVTIGRTTLAEDQTLADLAVHGYETPALAQTALDQLLEIASTQSVVPVLIAVDDINTFWTDTLYFDQEDKVLPACRLGLVRSLGGFFDRTKRLARGWAIGATSHVDFRFMPKSIKDKLDPPLMVPLTNPELAKDKNLVRPATKKPYKINKLNHMDSGEAWALLCFYRATNLIATRVTRDFVAKKWMLASGNPREIFTSVTSFA
ncbi:hypothetical protein H4R20_003812 [Coemansia guatemalensis]|uniref:Small ribosomal subunit protein mS29 n=1 Tax=Coemansia guatemalensis TaxID=2761395 RepID=A0A9W8LSN0_9FUNG|nr:hypothetical protein H4R20_003812 [Coemansia guatemalensis]